MLSNLIKKFCFGFDYAMSWAFLVVTGCLFWISRSNICEDPGGVLTEALCCAHCEGWRLGERDRQIHLFLAVLGVCINVVPKYIKKDESPRHLGAIGIQRWWNPLVVHIIGGIFTVLPGGMAGVFGWHSPAFMKFLVGSSLLHDISIYGLLKNHDGVWAIRAANLFLAIQKTIIALAPISPESKADLLSFMAFGFMGTRMLCTVWYILTALSLPSSLVDEYWYSGGLALAQFYIFVRCWQICGPVVFMSFVAAAMICYHKRWNRRYQAAFILSQVAMLAVAYYGPLAGNPEAQLTLMFVFYAATFKLPFWRRQRMTNAVLARSKTMPLPKTTPIVTKPTVKRAATMPLPNSNSEEAEADTTDDVPNLVLPEPLAEAALGASKLSLEAVKASPALESQLSLPVRSSNLMSLTDASENLELEDMLDLDEFEEDEDEPQWADLLSVAPNLPASLSNKRQTTTATTPTTDDGSASEATSCAGSPIVDVDEDEEEFQIDEADIKRPMLRRRKARSIVRMAQETPRGNDHLVVPRRERPDTPRPQVQRMGSDRSLLEGLRLMMVM